MREGFKAAVIMSVLVTSAFILAGLGSLAGWYGAKWFWK